MFETDRRLLRRTVRPEDAAAVRELVGATGFFSPAEINVAEELVLDRLRLGAASGYEFIFAEQDDRLNGYACFGEIPCTSRRYDLYWLAVEQEVRGQGLGRQLLAAAENDIRSMGGAHVYAETSSRDQYLPTRRFYEACGYDNIARLADFYAAGDDKVVYRKIL